MSRLRDYERPLSHAFTGYRLLGLQAEYERQHRLRGRAGPRATAILLAVETSTPGRKAAVHNGIAGRPQRVDLPRWLGRCRSCYLRQVDHQVRWLSASVELTALGSLHNVSSRDCWYYNHITVPNFVLSGEPKSLPCRTKLGTPRTNRSALDGEFTTRGRLENDRVVGATNDSGKILWGRVLRGGSYSSYSPPTIRAGASILSRLVHLRPANPGAFDLGNDACGLRLPRVCQRA